MAEIVKNILFPDYFPYQSQAGDSWSTQVITTASGFEIRNSYWNNPQRYFDISFDTARLTDMDRVRNFFNAVRGKLHSFRFRDWGDYLFRGDGDNTPVPFATYSGIKGYQLTKTYSYDGNSYVRAITLPRVQGSNQAPGSIWDTEAGGVDFEVYINSTKLTMGVHYTVSNTTGIVTLLTTQPAGTLSARYEYDIPCRFDTDLMDVLRENSVTETWASVKLKEVRV